MFETDERFPPYKHSFNTLICKSVLCLRLKGKLRDAGKEKKAEEDSEDGGDVSKEMGPSRQDDI